MGLVLHKEEYTVDTANLYSVSATVGGETVQFGIQCLQTKTNTEIETLIVARLLDKGYLAEELTPIMWE